MAGADTRRSAGGGVNLEQTAVWREALARVPGADTAGAVEVQTLPPLDLAAPSTWPALSWRR